MAAGRWSRCAVATRTPARALYAGTHCPPPPHCQRRRPAARVRSQPGHTPARIIIPPPRVGHGRVHHAASSTVVAPRAPGGRRAAHACRAAPCGPREFDGPREGPDGRGRTEDPLLLEVPLITVKYTIIIRINISVLSLPSAGAPWAGPRPQAGTSEGAGGPLGTSASREPEKGGFCGVGEFRGVRAGAAARAKCSAPRSLF
eukprot:scaffold973_cov399-Prasinococcus_capsulatus_cf.AAC.1